MALPSVSKTYQFNVGQAITAQGTALATNRRILRTIKNTLIGFGTLPWTVRESCDSVTAGSVGDGVDRWSSDSNLVWANSGSAHSWMVLRQTGIATNYEICISCESASANGSSLTLVVSPSAAFSGGSTTARPTATDEIALLSNAVWGGVGSTDSNAKIQAFQSTDGQVTRVFVHVSNTVRTYWSFTKPANAIAGWSNPSMSLALGSASSGVLTYTNLNTNANGKGRVGSTTCSFYMTGEAFGGSMLGQQINFAGDISSNYPISPIGLASLTTSNRDRYGTVYDAWWGADTLSEGTTYPNDASRTHVQFGVMVFPWDGSVVVTS